MDSDSPIEIYTYDTTHFIGLSHGCSRIRNSGYQSSLLSLSPVKTLQCFNVSLFRAYKYVSSTHVMVPSTSWVAQPPVDANVSSILMPSIYLIKPGRYIHDRKGKLAILRCTYR
jgi:hypothetical protein